MPNKKFSALDPATLPLSGSEIVPIIQADVPSRTTPAAIAALATKTTVGLGNVDNTSDVNKPVSTATQTALDGKQSLDTDLTAIAGLDSATAGAIASDGAGWIKKTYAQFKTALGLVKADVGLGNADDTSDVNKPVSTATQAALDGKQALDADLTTIAGLTATTDNFMVANASAWASRTPAQAKTSLALVKGDVGLGNVDNIQQQPLDADLTALAGLSGVEGDIIYRNATQWQRLPKGTANQLLRQNAGLTAPEWATIAGGGDVVGDDTSTTAQNIVAYTGTGGKNITELTGTQGDVLYHNGTSWVKLAKGTANQRLSMNAGATAPEWQTVAGGGMTTLRKTANQTINAGAATFVDITDLTFPVVAGTDYAFFFYITFRSAATTTGWKSGVNHPGGTLDFWATSPIIANGAAGVATHTERHNVTVNDMTLLTATVTAGVDLAVRIEGRYLCTTNGTFAARFANELAANTDLVVQKGSWGYYF